MNKTALLSLALEPNADDDRRKLASGLHSLIAEDPAARVATDRASGQIIVHGAGERHLEIIIDRLRREHGVEASAGTPRVAYKETITRPVAGGARRSRHHRGLGSAISDVGLCDGPAVAYPRSRHVRHGAGAVPPRAAR